MLIENIIKAFKNFFSGSLKFKNGINKTNTKPILKDAIKIGGTELFSANLATGKALPCATIIKIRMNKCLTGNSLNFKNIF
tara:strand:+ start:518 stop:760 length:243 start_codon:yes stop_codon:yes gene_type:complete